MYVSHGATFNKKKLGTFGLISFIFIMLISTIEGGMICTNDNLFNNNINRNY